MRTLILAASVLAFAATPSLAAPCKDAKGKFVKCPEAKPKPKATKCRLNGKFASCSAKGAKPI